MDPDTIELGWLNEDDIVTDDSRVTIIRSSNHSANISSNFNTIITTVIQFDPFFEDDKGNYSCYSIANKSVKYISTPLNNFTSELRTYVKCIFYCAYVHESLFYLLHACQ